jgi:hypothetical protein
VAALAARASNQNLDAPNALWSLKLELRARNRDELLRRGKQTVTGATIRWRL